MPDGAQLTPIVPLEEGEWIVASFHADPQVYLRDMTWMAAIAMGLGMAVLWLASSPHVWTGAVGGLAAIALRGLYLRSDELAARWDLTDRRLLGPGGRAPRLKDTVRVRGLASAVQIVTRSGEKHQIKYQADREETAARIRQAVTLAGGRLT